MSYFHFGSCVIIWSMSFLMMKKAAIGFEPLSVAAWRVLLGGSLLGLVFLVRRRPRQIVFHHFLPMMFVIGLGFVWPFSIQPLLVGRVGSGLLGMSVGLVPLMTVVFSAALLRSFPSRLQTLGILGAVGALTMLFWDRMRLDIAVTDLALVLTVPASYALSNVIVRRWLRGIPAVELNVVCLLGASLCLAAWLSGPRNPAFDSPVSSFQATMCLLFLGLLGTGLAQVFYTRMIQERGPLFASMANNLVPVGAVLLGWWDDEAVTMPQLMALCVVVTMVGIVQMEERRKNTLSRIEAGDGNRTARTLQN